jgi:hypothetical protein
MWGLRLLQLLVDVVSVTKGPVYLHFNDVCETMCHDLIAAAAVVGVGASGEVAGAPHPQDEATLARTTGTIAVMASSPALLPTVQTLVSAQTCINLITSRSRFSSATQSSGLVVTSALELLTLIQGEAALARVQLGNRKVLRLVGKYGDRIGFVVLIEWHHPELCHSPPNELKGLLLLC